MLLYFFNYWLPSCVFDFFLPLLFCLNVSEKEKSRKIKKYECLKRHITRFFSYLLPGENQGVGLQKSLGTTYHTTNMTG